MSTQNKKQSAANLAEKGKQAALKAVESTREATGKVVNMSADAVKEFWETGAKEARNTQEKVLAYGREHSRNLAKSTDSAARNFADAVEISREHAEALVESSNVAAEYARKIAEQVYAYANTSFASGVEHSKNLFSCRTMNDVVELNNRAFMSNVDALFNESVKLSELVFKLATEVVEPVQARASQTSERITRAMAA